MADVVTKEDITNEVNAEIKELLVESSKVVKKYIDESIEYVKENSIANKVKRDELKTEIENAIAKKYDFENEKAKLDKASEVAETLLGLFDADSNGELDPKEFLAKLDEIYAKLGTTDELQGKLEDLAKQATDLKSELDTKIAEVTGRTKSNSDNIAKLQAQITNVFTKEEVKEALTINKDEIISAVNEIFNPTSSDKSNNGDGATL